MRPPHRSIIIIVTHGFPRPSGRGSIAAGRSRPLRSSLRPPSPGHQAGAPLRHVGERDCTRRGRDLPPAIRPGLHCGVARRSRAARSAAGFPRPSGRGSIAARRGGSACRSGRRLPPAIRPGLHCGPWMFSNTSATSPAFPRPSGQGLHCGTPSTSGVASHGTPLPPAIRPGLHCGSSALWTE